MTSKAAEHARNGWRHGSTSRAAKHARGIGYFGSAAIVIFMLAAVIFHANRNLSTAPLAPTETITRFVRVIDGKPVQCERREDHVHGTTETAC